MYNVLIAQPIVQHLPLPITCIDNTRDRTLVGTSSDVLAFHVDDDPFQIDLLNVVKVNKVIAV